jgi:hypothetical protein
MEKGRAYGRDVTHIASYLLQGRSAHFSTNLGSAVCASDGLCYKKKGPNRIDSMAIMSESGIPEMGR